ncbi:MAG TPA: tetrahydrofolate dehydrogenase/cyclohydrolase catalytic domain-containing protein [Bacteroidia bacterium]|nr:tetrahydrofolate dehydrogenase/cyclohydrolase catalytic domain-containing protein [Bacteroidia bacterium]HNT81018.1 tetrahydrofolate dehydrogenase/cyclohydrolase catalytic domain-containing protein [Bacteroidia bacterium]
MQLLDGKICSAFYKEKLKAEVNQRIQSGLKRPHLAAILVGDDGASETYVASKIKNCKELGFDSSLVRLSANVSEEQLIDEIIELNNDSNIDGFIVQLPLPAHLNEERITSLVSPIKDVDGFHPENTGKMVQGLPCFLPATPKGILMMLEHYKIETSGKHCVVIGRSNIVGTPMSVLMSRATYPGNCTVTLCHSKTVNIKEISRNADILIVALGKAEFVNADWVKEGAVVVDVGITRVEDKSKKSGFRICGDVHFDSVAEKSSFITPVPGGVGLMTIVALLENTMLACRLNDSK